MGAQLLEKASVNGVSPLYQQRNAMVSAAAKAGKTRWGPMEAEKATLLSENALPAATDSSSSLSSQYVNLGAQLLGSTVMRTSVHVVFKLFFKLSIINILFSPQ